MNETHALYRFFGLGDELLYIGITFDPGIRWRQHAKEKPWWHEVIRITIETFPDREAVLDAEEVAIKAERPKYNVVHNREHLLELELHRTRGFPKVDYAPAGSGMWRFRLRGGSQASHVTPLWLFWEVVGDPISDNYSTDEVDAYELWYAWRRALKGDPTAVPIHWFVEGAGILEAASFQHQHYGPEYGIKYFLDAFTWPRDVNTNEPLQFSRLPVVDKAWRSDMPRTAVDKGGFIQEATGWKPSVLQPFMDVRHIEQLARL